MAKQIRDAQTADIYAPSKVAVTATTGSLPAANGAVTIADAAAPTVAELLELCMELKAQIDVLSN